MNLVKTLFCLLVGMAVTSRADNARQSTIGAGEPAVKLGVIADASLGPAADLLTADLTKVAGIELLERNAINRILQEQKLSLSGLTGEHVIQTGRLLGADGLVLLQRKAEATHDVIIFRLIAVRPGVVIHAATYPIPVKDEVDGHREVADLIRLRVMRHLGRLRTDEAQAVRVSLLNFAATYEDKAASASAQRLDQMLAERLMDDPTVFVLERRKLGVAAEEKIWSGGNEPFWTGSVLIEGEVQQDLTGGGRMNLLVRIRPPEAKEAVEIEDAGLLAKPEESLERLLPRIREALGSRSTAKWDSYEEGRLFFQQAKRAKELSDKKAAIEAAWNLGYRELEAAVLRLRVEVEEAESILEAGRNYAEGIDGLVGAATFAVSYSERKPPNAPVDAAKQLASEKAWKNFQRELLEVAKSYLRGMWQNEEFLHPGEARALREQLPVIIDRIWDPSTEEGARVTALLTNYGRFYFSSPELAVATYRKILMPRDQLKPWKDKDDALDNLAYARESLLLPRQEYPRYVSSSAEERRRFDTLWAALRSDFARHANGDAAASPTADQFLARMADPATDKLEVLWEARELVARRLLGSHFIAAALRNPTIDLRKRTEFSVKFLEYIGRESASRWGNGELLSGGVLQPFLESYDAAQARRVYKALLAAAAKEPPTEPLTWYLKESLLKLVAKHPSLRQEDPSPDQKMEPLNVDRVIWRNKEAIFEARPNGLQWIEGRLWFSIPNALVSIDVQTGEQKTIAIPPEINPLITGRRNYFTVSGGTPVIVSSYDPNTADLYVQRDGAWRKFPAVPPATVHPVILGDFLYYGFRNGRVRGIARLRLEDGQAEILSSSEEKIRTGVFDGPTAKIASMMIVGNEEVWTRTFGGENFCYSTRSGTWQRRDPAEWTSREEARHNVVGDEYRPMSLPGTPLRLLSLESASEETGGFLSLWIREEGKAGKKIPLRFAEGFDSGSGELRDRRTDKVMMTPHGLLFPMMQDYAICFLPFEDLELAIAGHLPPGRAPQKATKSAADSAPAGDIHLAVLSVSPGGPDLKWREFDSGMPASRLHLVAQGNGLYVATGFVMTGHVRSGDSIAVSADGTSWRGRPPRKWGGNFTDMAFGAGRFVIVGHKGLILSSKDGLDWTVEQSRAKANLFSVCFARGLFVAVGDGGTILTSKDGREWSIQGSGTVLSINRVMNHSGKFLALAQWLSQPLFLTSSDGVRWAREELLIPDVGREWVSNIACTGGSVMLLFGLKGEDVALTRTGESWSVGKLPGLGRAFSSTLSVVNGSYYLPAADSRIFTSKDGLEWKVQASDRRTVGKIVQLGDWLYSAGDLGKILRAKVPGESPP